MISLARRSPVRWGLYMAILLGMVSFIAHWEALTSLSQSPLLILYITWLVKIVVSVVAGVGVVSAGIVLGLSRSQQAKRAAPSVLKFCTALLLGIPISSLLFAYLLDPFQKAVVANMQQNSQPLIDAIVHYQHEHEGVPPQNLDQLQPTYLKELPRNPVAFGGYHYRAVEGRGSGKWYQQLEVSNELAIERGYWRYLFTEQGWRYGE